MFRSDSTGVCIGTGMSTMSVRMRVSIRSRSRMIVSVKVRITVIRSIRTIQSALVVT